MISSRYRVLDADIGLTGPEDVVRPIDAAYRRFRTDADPAGASRQVEVRPGHPGELSLDGRSRPLVDGIDPTLQTYQPFLEFILDDIERHAVLHAGAVLSSDGSAYVIAGPSGMGKSSLTLELAHRGHRLLGDDYAPLDLARQQIAPYPRALGLLEGGAPLPERARTALHDPGSIRLFGKVLVDPGDLFGEHCLARVPAPLRGVIVLVPGDGSVGFDVLPSTIELAIRLEDSDPIRSRLERIDGLQIVAARPTGGVLLVEAALDPGRHPTSALAGILEEEAVLFSEKFCGLEPDFDAEPEATPIRRREAAIQLGRELLNRRQNGRLMQHYRQSVPALFVDLAAALRHAACWKVSVGRFSETADCIATLMDDR